MYFKIEIYNLRTGLIFFGTFFYQEKKVQKDKFLVFKIF